MNCRDFEMTITTLAGTEALDEITRDQSLAHAEACERCAARLAEERALLSGVRTVVEDMTCQRAPARVEAALLLALQERVAAGFSSHILPMPQKRDGTRWIWGAAAAAVLALISTILV